MAQTIKRGGRVERPSPSKAPVAVNLFEATYMDQKIEEYQHMPVRVNMLSKNTFASMVTVMPDNHVVKDFFDSISDRQRYLLFTNDVSRTLLIGKKVYYSIIKGVITHVTEHWNYHPGRKNMSLTHVTYSDTEDISKLKEQVHETWKSLERLYPSIKDF